MTVLPLHDGRLRVQGPWPFVTLRSYLHEGRHIVWRARQSRKGLINRAGGARPARDIPMWRTAGYNLLTGGLFAAGSLLFMVGAVLSLLPAGWPGAPSTLAINLTFFAGSVPFTTAGYLQHFQAANAPEFTPAGAEPHRHPVSLIGWHPRSPGWISTFAQFIGTIGFNFNTFDAIHAPAGWFSQDLVIWIPGMVGSVLFLISSYLAFIETCHAYWAWRPKELDWWIVFANLLGCIFFMTASTLAYVPMEAEPDWIADAANVNLALGALGFLVGAVLTMVESSQAASRKD